MLKKAIRLLWGAQPRPLRRAELWVLDRLLTRALPAQRPLEKGNTVICGFLGTASGLGQGARQMLALFRAKGLAVQGANASRFAVLEDFEAGPFWPEDAPDGGAVIFHVNPDVLSLVWGALGRKRLGRRLLVGFWAWELETPPARWRRAVKLVDEIWAPSSFVADAMRKIAGDKPVHVMPYPFDVAAVRQTPQKDPLPELAGKTVVFFSYDVRSLHARKNPEAVIEAFRQAAAGNPNAALVLKINNAATWPEALTRVQRAASGLDNVVILQKMLSVDEMKDLIARVDIVMSLHRSEGFGLLMADAMAAGKPVIATGWSANLDFMTPESGVLVGYKLIPIEDPQHIYDKYGAVWADPDVGEAARALAKLLADPDARARMGRAARAQAEAFFSEEKGMNALPASFWATQEKPRVG